jgi:hypothetical protein
MQLILGAPQVTSIMRKSVCLTLIALQQIYSCEIRITFYLNYFTLRSFSSAMCCWMEGRGSISGMRNRFFCTPQRPDGLWDTPSLLSNWYRGKAAGVCRWLLTSIQCRGEEWWRYAFRHRYVSVASLIKRRDSFTFYLSPYSIVIYFWLMDNIKKPGEPHNMPAFNSSRTRLSS